LSLLGTNGLAASNSAMMGSSTPYSGPRRCNPPRADRRPRRSAGPTPKGVREGAIDIGRCRA
jgi:hypothetical protein